MKSVRARSCKFACLLCIVVVSFPMLCMSVVNKGMGRPQSVWKLSCNAKLILFAYFAVRAQQTDSQSRRINTSSALNHA